MGCADPLLRRVGVIHQCPLESVASYYCHSMLTCDIQMTHHHGRHGGKNPDAWKDDYSMTHLGYTTDNGAYYYYLTEPGKNYEETILALKDYSK